MPAAPADPGLNADEIQRRIGTGRTNLAPPSASPSVRRILARNLLNPINLIFAVAVIAVVAVGAGFDAVFALPLMLNIAIAVLEELYAKRRLDQLTVLVTPQVTVRRGGQAMAVPRGQVVADDICVFQAGDQIVADGPLIEAGGLEVDESSLTGESDPVAKQPGDWVASGTFVMAGTGAYRAKRIGADSTAARLRAEAQADREVGTSIQRDLVGLLVRIAVIAGPVLACYVVVELTHHLGTLETVRGTVAATISLLPEGLLLLTSTRFALGAIRLAKHGLVTTRLDAVESIARVDVLCVDKTGTITENCISVAEVVAASGVPQEGLEDVLGRFGASMPAPNRTVAALAQAFPRRAEPAVSAVPFSSARRWSGLALDGSEGIRAWILGAPEAFAGYRDAVPATGRVGGARRVLWIGEVEPTLLRPPAPGPQVPPSRILGTVVFDDVLRAGAAGTLAYFTERGVAIKVISGDHPHTVRAVAARAGLTSAGETTGDAMELLAPEQQVSAAEGTEIFGRVSPQQKRLIVDALKRGGHHVAMTGDGVNDVLALRAADVGIALQEGTAAAQSVASLIMLEGAFAHLPDAMREGRRIVEGITVGARFFLLKTFYSLVITGGVTAVALIGGGSPIYPLHPRNLSALATLSIGLPALVLSVANRRPDPPKGRFVPNVLRLALPAGIVVGIAAIVAFYLDRGVVGATLNQARSATTLALGGAALAFIPCAELAADRGPHRRLGLAMALALICGLAFPIIFAVPVLRAYYDVVPLDAGQYGLAFGIGGLGAAALVLLTTLVRKHYRHR